MHGMHAPCHAHPPAMHPPHHICPLPCTPPTATHAPPTTMHAPLPCTPPAMHTPCHASPHHARPLWGVHGPGWCMVLGVHGPRGCMVPGMHGPGGGAWSQGCMVPGASQHALRQTPPVNRMTDRCKNITLSQTSLADGNKKLIHHSKVNGKKGN